MLARVWLLLVLALAPLPAMAAVRVFAASSLTEAMTDAADAWAAAGHDRPLLVFQGSPALARQIIAGAPAGMFIAADSEWMDEVAKGGKLVPGSRRAIAGNRLVLVVPATAPRTARLIKGFDMAAFVGAGRWTTGDPQSVPVGRYARAALTWLGGWAAAEPKLARAENVRSALAFVERGDAAAGIVYATDARATAKVTVAGVFPAASHPPIIYPAALVTGADAEAKAFLAFLAGPTGQAILKARGFTVP